MLTMLYTNRRVDFASGPLFNIPPYGFLLSLLSLEISSVLLVKWLIYYMFRRSKKYLEILIKKFKYTYIIGNFNLRQAGWQFNYSLISKKYLGDRLDMVIWCSSVWGSDNYNRRWTRITHGSRLNYPKINLWDWFVLNPVIKAWNPRAMELKTKP